MEGSKKFSSRRSDDQSGRNDGKNNDGSSCTEERIRKAAINECENCQKIQNKINQFRKHRKTNQLINRNFTIIKRSNKTVQALNLPKVLNINPRSAMNKINELETFIKEENIDVAFISERHDRENKKLEENINLEDHLVISNIYQRVGKGGRPALIINKQKFNVQNLTNTLIDVPWGCRSYLGTINT